MRNDAVGVEHDNNRMRDTVRITAGGVVLVQQTECANDFGFGIGENRIFNSAAFCEARYCRDGIVSYRRDLVAERSEFIDPFVPGDRLDNAEGSPIERS